MTARRAFVLLLAAPYVAWLVLAYQYHFLDHVNLALHEGGHLFLGFFGQTIHVAGGTIGQLFFPLACAAHFEVRGDRFSAAICVVWAAESLMYTAEYLGDAKDQVLPLVGGHIHDWHWLLSKAGLLDQCRGIEAVLHVVASAVAVFALRMAWRAGGSPARDLERHGVATS